MRYMLDTNICIYIAKQHSERLQLKFQAIEEGGVVMSAITHAELRAGIGMQTAHRAHDEKVLDMLIQRIPVLPFDAAASMAYGTLRAAVPDRRRDALDRLIAAHALSLDATLVTNNEADFKDYPGLKVENWAAAS